MSPAARGPWPCTIYGRTYGIDGSCRKIERRFDGAGDVYGAALVAITNRRDHGAPFIGCGLEIRTPMHNLEVVLEEQALPDGRIVLVLQREEADKWVTVAGWVQP